MAICRMQVALVQLNSTVGDVAGNLDLMVNHILKRRSEGAQLIIFPEMSLAGYPPEDLLFRSSFLERLKSKEAELIAATTGVMVVFGTVSERDGLYNEAVVAADGKEIGRIAKQHLPNYGVFDEARYFTPGQDTAVFHWGPWSFGVSVCEDLWYPDGPYLAQTRHGANVLINISASPYSHGKGRQREQMMATRAADAAAFLLWTNLVGAQDELVFDGESGAFAPDGRIIGRAQAFEEEVVRVSLDRLPSQHRRWIDPRWRQGHGDQAGPVAHVRIPLPDPEPSKTPDALKVSPLLDGSEELYRALVLGVHDYIEKNRFGDVVIGLSGGIDSALTAVIAVDALGASRVHGVFMPSAITSEESYQDARGLAQNLAIDWREIGIGDVLKTFMHELEPHFGARPRDLTEENLQARIRGTLLMALSNKMGWLVLTTGNKSEMATGYSTLYGDMAGGFAVLKDVLKTEVFRLSRWVNRDDERIPARVLVKPPTAELRPDQKDEDSLPPYAILDQILRGYIEDDLSPEDLIRRGLSREFVELTIGLVNRNEYKRRQAPVGIKVTPRAFGRDRRMPITGRF